MNKNAKSIALSVWNCRFRIAHSEWVLFGHRFFHLHTEKGYHECNQARASCCLFTKQQSDSEIGLNWFQVCATKKKLIFELEAHTFRAKPAKWKERMRMCVCEREGGREIGLTETLSVAVPVRLYATHSNVNTFVFIYFLSIVYGVLSGYHHQSLSTQKTVIKDNKNLHSSSVSYSASTKHSANVYLVVSLEPVILFR